MQRLIAQAELTLNADAGFLGWDASDAPMLIALPVLVVLSGFFSGSETALFGMSETQRIALRRGSTLSDRAAAALLADPRMLLISVLLGNMTVNVLFFVISSVLLMNADQAGPLAAAVIVISTLLIIVLLGEVLPKLLASVNPLRFAGIISPPLFAFHRAIGPLRIVLDRYLVAPLSRLTSPTSTPSLLDHDELAALLEISWKQGVIDADEQRLLQDVLRMSQLKVRDVMTHRVRMIALPADAMREEILDVVRETKLTRLPVFEDTPDQIIGLLHVKRFLSSTEAAKTARENAQPVQFVPEVASLDQLLEHFRTSHTQTAIVVDEYGGTAGIVAIEDVVERIVGDIAAPGDTTTPQPQRISETCWRVSGDLSVHDWAPTFGQRIVSPRVATIGGLILQKLGRVPESGDVVHVGNVELRVEETDQASVLSAVVTIHESTRDEEGLART